MQKAMFNFSFNCIVFQLIYFSSFNVLNSKFNSGKYILPIQGSVTEMLRILIYIAFNRDYLIAYCQSLKNHCLAEIYVMNFISFFLILLCALSRIVSPII